MGKLDIKLCLAKIWNPTWVLHGEDLSVMGAGASPKLRTLLLDSIVRVRLPDSRVRTLNHLPRFLLSSNPLESNHLLLHLSLSLLIPPG